MPAAEVQPVGRHVRGGVEQHVPAVRVRLLDPFERVLDAGEVRLRRVGEQVVVIARRVGQVARQQVLVDAQVGRDARHVRGLGAAGASELADPVDRVVVVEGQQEPVAGMERIRLADQPQRAGRVRGEDRHVLIRRRIEELQHRRAGALGELGARRRGRVDRVRVAEHAALQQPHVLAQLRLGEQPAAGVVEVHVAAAVKPREIAARAARRARPCPRTRDGSPRNAASRDWV